MILSAQDDNGDETPPDTDTDTDADADADADADKKPVIDKKPPKKSEEVSQKAAGEKRIWIKIFNSSGVDGDRPVFVSCSGDAVLIKREKWAHVKQKHVNVLDGAVETHFEDRVPRPVRRYRYEKSATKPDDAED